MKKYYKFIIKITGENDNVILENDIWYLPIREDVIFEKSIEFFNDPEPCMIHRSAVMKRVYMELFDYLDRELGSCESRCWECIPQPVDRLVSISDKVKQTQIRRQNK